MDIAYPTDAEQFRARVRQIIDTNLPDGWRGFGALAPEEQEGFLRDWRKVLAEHDLLALSWPREYGGGGLTAIEQVIVAEELARAGAPDGIENDSLGIKLLGNTIVTLGTEEQKSFFLPRILSGEHVWCQGYSEPEAGSDLAGLRTRAVLDGDEWVINGQKTWTSSGDNANWMFVVARTDPTVVKHKGLTFLLVPMDQPGVEVRPIVNAAGHIAFNEVFFTDARTPAANVLGGVGNGWKTTNTLLGFERGVRATTDSIRFSREIDRLIELARERGLNHDPIVRQELAWCVSQVRLMRARGYRALTSLLSGARPGVDGSFSKVIWAEFFQRYSEIAGRILGLDVMDPTGPGNGAALVTAHFGAENSTRTWTDIMLYARAGTIYGGSSQIQRNIIGEQLLGLPREPRMDAGPFQDMVRTTSS